MATGDLNGDGYDNEVVTAFKDSGKDLQVVVMRPDSAGATFKSIFYWDSYSGNPKIDTIADTCSSNWSNFRPIDVATGDLDGDYKDEVIVAAREGPCNDNGDIQLLAFDFNPEDASHNLTINTSVPVPRLEVEFASFTYVAAPTVSISADDLDGDGYDEIALGWMMEHYTGSGNYSATAMLATYEYVRSYTPEANQYCARRARHACASRIRSGIRSQIGGWDFTAGNEKLYAPLSIATGDVNSDGMSEIALARIDTTTKQVEVSVFRAQSSLSLLDKLVFNKDLNYTLVTDLAIAMGDYDGDNIWGTYNNKCYVRGDALVQAVLRAPPFWPEGSNAHEVHNDYDTWASFAGDTGQEQSDGTSTETTMGTSAETEKEFEIRKVKVTASFGREWEKSVVQETTTMTSTHFGLGTHTGAPVYKPKDDPQYTPSWSGVLVMETDQWCYEYNVPDGSNTIVMPVCVTQDSSHPANYRTSTWYAEGGGRTLFPHTWVPVGVNLAADTAKTQRIASQSSTYTSVATQWGCLAGHRRQHRRELLPTGRSRRPPRMRPQK